MYEVLNDDEILYINAHNVIFPFKVSNESICEKFKSK